MGGGGSAVCVDCYTSSALPTACRQTTTWRCVQKVSKRCIGTLWPHGGVKYPTSGTMDGDDWTTRPPHDSTTSCWERWLWKRSAWATRRSGQRHHHHKHYKHHWISDRFSIRS